ncbi:hypothetical protein FRB91_008598 [Serendipita sp. 411]|nr:hypothetical protein FRB91_008598 [Serendipita sp. 411]
MSATINLSQNDKIIVVLGATGAGKSTFIDYATNGGGGGIGHGMRSFTENIRVVRAEGLTGDGRPVVFVDIPGFGATDKSNIQILAMVASFLAKA